MTKPFAGVRVLDFTQVFAGPFGSYQLALLGADVIKIERPGGEDMRRSPLNKEWAGRNMATAWMAINSNKRNIALDLTKPKSIEIVHRLAKKADVVMENFRPGIMDRMGIGYEVLSGIITTGSSPMPVDAEGQALCFQQRFKDDPAAMGAWLWKDHTGNKEAAQITQLASEIRPQYLSKIGGTYSSEWWWSKILHCKNVAKDVFEAAASWIEICDGFPPS